ncbi:MAG: nucleotidyltransferase family protein [Chloroflexi bacterium]|nr:nucleotidyltransferase family protein [Chloroflexota bacterium]
MPGRLRTDRSGDRPFNASTEEVLRLCLRGNWDPAALDRVRALAADDGVDWVAFRQLAADEWVIPLVFQAVRGAGIVPPPVEEEFGRAYFAAAARNALLLSALQDVLARLDAVGVQTLLLKGAALIGTVYPNAAQRPMEDLDLLVHRLDLPAALNALGALGFVDQRTGQPAHVEARYENEVELFKPGPFDIAVDLHWNWVDSPYAPHKEIVDWLWEKALPAASGNPTLVLCPEALLLHLCVHFLIDKNRRRSLRLHDIGQLLRRYRQELDWNLVLTQARRFDLVLPLRNVLSQAEEELELGVPAVVQEQLDRLAPSPAEKSYFAWLAGSEPHEYQVYSANLASRRGWRARGRYVWQELFPPPQYLMKLYRLRCTALVPMLYPYRWFRGLAHAADMTIHHGSNHAFDN